MEIRKSSFRANALTVSFAPTVQALARHVAVILRQRHPGGLLAIDGGVTNRAIAQVVFDDWQQSRPTVKNIVTNNLGIALEPVSKPA
jgi:hypothetical protein